MNVVYFLWGLLIHLDLVLMVGMLAGLVVYWLRGREYGRSVFFKCFFLFMVLLIVPLGRWMITYQENRFPRIEMIQEEFEGLILLGGALSSLETEHRGIPIYNMAGARILEFIQLALKHPDKPIIFTGTAAEAANAEKVFESVGIDMNRVTIESAAKDTRDNAQNSYDLVQPKAGSKWVLVTSAFHMPRSVGLFRKAGWDVIPYPVNHLGSGDYSKLSWLLGLNRMNLAAWSVAMKEWAGMYNNYREGYSRHIFPKPS